MNVLLRNGSIFDGTGAPEWKGDVLIENGRIAAIAPAIPAEAARVVDCTGLAVAPGFIDAHSHSDLQVLENRPEKVRQGVTTEVVGNCGFSAFPLGGHAAAVREFANGIFHGGGGWGWQGASAYLADAASRGTAAGVFTLAGHGSLRVAHAGMQQGELDPAIRRQLAGSLESALANGAKGLSTGLMYAPGSSAPEDELIELCSIAGCRGALHCTHMRSYSGELLPALEEQVRIARRAGCRLQISHLQAVGRANWPLQEQALERIEGARREGIDVEFDSYPYLAGSTVLTQLLPQDALDGGTAALLGRLADPAIRKEIARHTNARLAQSWSDILISGVRTAANRPLAGMTVAEVAARRGVEPAEAALDLLIEEEAAVNIISFNQSQENLRMLLTHPLCTVVSDGFYVEGLPHPRLCGTFPELLGKYCREERWLTLTEAIHKITLKPARRFGLNDRGELRRGARADIAVFDPASVGSRATYSDPWQPPVGIRLVLREGREVYRDL